jgi:hypothetical protein
LSSSLVKERSNKGTLKKALKKQDLEGNQPAKQVEFTEISRLDSDFLYLTDLQSFKFKNWKKKGS